MGIIDIVLLICVAAALFFAVRKCIKDRRAGKCCGCSCCAKNCGSCGSHDNCE